MQSISWTWPKQKVCFFCFQQLKYKLESLLAVYFKGNTSDVHHVSMRSPCTDIEGAGTQVQVLLGRTKTSGVSGRTVLTAKSCWFGIGWGPSWHRPRFMPLIHVVCNVFSPPRFPTREKAISFSSSSIICDWRDGMRLWASLSNRDAGRCHLLGPGLHGAQNHLVRERRCWGRYVHNTQSLVLIGKALLKWTKLGGSTPYVLCFWHFNLWRISIQNTLLWGPHSTFQKAVLQNRGKLLILSWSTVLCTFVICQYWYHNSLYNQKCARDTNLSYFKTKTNNKKVLWSLCFLTLSKISFGNSKT